MSTDNPTNDPTGSFGPGDSTQELWKSHRHATDAMIGQTIGRYHIKRMIASGGMGTVYEAVQASPRRTVALKVMKHGVTSKSALRRFEYESQILARLRHPGIAQVYDAGTHDDGLGSVPYFAMEYIPNAKPITQYVREKKLSTRERLELFANICDAVYHGHQKGIIHRDLKPSNILVDSSGQPKVIDFGVARATDSDLAVTTLQTDVGQLIGTLQYMSPEQCDADPHDIDTRSDVYALGVVLYEMLCEQLPYDVTKVALYEAARMIREEPPTRPSSFKRTLRGDIETIALKALEKERDRRYRSAADFGADIQHYLNNEPIAARRASMLYHARTFARRNKALVGGVAAVFVVLVAGLIATSAMYVQAEHARAAEAEQRRIAEESEQRAIEEAQRAEREAERALAAEVEAQANADAARRELVQANAVRAAFLRVVAMAVESHRNEEPPVTVQEAIDAVLTETGAGKFGDDPQAQSAVANIAMAMQLGMGRVESGEVQREQMSTGASRHLLDALERARAQSEDAFRLYPEGHAILWDKVRSQAFLERQIGSNDHAAAILERALLLAGEATAGEKASLLGSLGLTLMKQDKFGEAVDVYRRSLALTEVRGGATAIAFAQMNLAEALMADKQPTEAAPLAESAWPVFEKLPEQHPSRIWAADVRQQALSASP